MADRVLFIGWGATTPGREEASLDVFNEAVGLYGRLQQEGRIEAFDVALLDPNADLAGYIELHGSSAQLAAVRADEEFRKMLIAASLIVGGLRLIDGYKNEGVAHELELFREAAARVPQTA